jgi:hypothetical protein
MAAYNFGAMALDGSYEAKLLRVLIGYFHVSVLQQTALSLHGKPFHSLGQEEKNSLETDVLAAVMKVAHQLTDEALSGKLKAPLVN